MHPSPPPVDIPSGPVSGRRQAPPLLLASTIFVGVYLAALYSRLLPVAADLWSARMASGWLLIAAGLAFVELGRRQSMAPRVLTGWLVACVLAVFALTRAGVHDPSVLLLKDLAQLGFAAVLGAVLATQLRSVEVLLTISVVVTLTDLWSVTRGVTRALIEANALEYFLLNFPVLLRAEVGSFIGTSDFVLAALYLAFAERAPAPRWRAPAALFIGMAAACTLAMALHKPLPVMPFIVPFYHLLVFPKRPALSREGLHLMVAGLATVVVVILLFG